VLGFWYFLLRFSGSAQSKKAGSACPTRLLKERNKKGLGFHLSDVVKKFRRKQKFK
jgi:hypothetical protein